MNIKHYIATLFLILFTSISSFACTGFLIGRNASADGSTMITYAADSHLLYGELYEFPAKDYPKGGMLDIYEWDTGKYLGAIPQVSHTYKVTGNMNEFQLSISESTFGGRGELVDTTGLIDYGSLIYIALQRARTAREAITVMTQLVEQYGYYSSGESFSIADPKEVWIMELIGKGPRNKGAVWVAVRIPDDCIAAHANQARIRTFPLEDKENCLYSHDVISFAREKGYFDGLNKDFSFADTYAPLDFGSLRGCEARVWSFYNKFVDGMDKYLPYLNGESTEAIPLYMKPNRKLTINEVKNAMRDHFEGTPFDMTKDVGAGPYAVPYRWRPMNFTVDGQTYVNERAIATQQTGFSFVAQMRSWLPNEIGGVLWFGVDDANTCVYVPLYNSITEVPHSFKVGNGDMLTFSWSSAFWINNWIANMVYHKYSYMIEDIRPLQKSLEKGFEEEQSAIDLAAMELYKKDRQSAIAFLNSYSNNKAQTTFDSWKKMGEYLMVKYIDGNVKKEKEGRFLRNEYGTVPESPNQPGYNEEYYRAIAKDAGERLKVKE